MESRRSLHSRRPISRRPKCYFFFIVVVESWFSLFLSVQEMVGRWRECLANSASVRPRLGPARATVMRANPSNLIGIQLPPRRRFVPLLAIFAAFRPPLGSSGRPHPRFRNDLDPGVPSPEPNSRRHRKIRNRSDLRGTACLFRTLSAPPFGQDLCCQGLCPE
jgi:hypothetical protein